jgi:hypothetical protein
MIPANNGEEPRKERLGFMDVLKKIRDAQQARNYQCRSIEEMRTDEAQRKLEEEEYEARWRAIGIPESSEKQPERTA